MSKLSYTHRAFIKYPLESGEKYCYTVKAYNSSSKKWGPYNKKGISVTIPSIPGKVELRSVSADSRGVTINWEKADHATHYYIYYKPYASIKWLKLATVKADRLRYTYPLAGQTKIKAEESYDFTVRAYNASSKKLGTIM